MASSLSKDDFTFVRFLRRSCFGTVAVVQQKGELAKNVVLKGVNLTQLISDGNNRNAWEFAKSIAIELEKMTNVDHAHLLRIFGSFEEDYSGMEPSMAGDKFFYLVTEFCEGGSLATIIDTAKTNIQPIPEWQIQLWSRQLVTALRFLHHEIRVSHGDINPNNIFFTSTNRRVVKLGDFALSNGISVFTSITSTSKWQYASPDICQGLPLSKPDDIWSLGVVLFELANLNRPFLGSGSSAIYSICSKDPEPFANVKEYSQELVDLTLSMLTKNAPERPTSDQILRSSQFWHIQLPENRKKSSTNGLEKRDKQGRTALMQAAQEGHLEVINWLLSQGAEVEADDTDGLSAIHLAASSGHLEIVQRLLAKGPSLIEATGRDSPLHCAASKGHLDIVEYLVDMKADVDMKNQLQRTPLMLAACEGHLPVVEFLHRKKAEIDPRSVHLAAGNGYLEVVKFLLSNSQDSDLVDAKIEDNVTPLNAAAQHGHLKIVMYLVLEKKATIDNRRLSNRRTPFLDASVAGHLETVRWFMDGSEADWAATDDKEANALHLAAYCGHVDVVRFLVKRRPILLTCKAIGGDLPLAYAQKGKNKAIIEMLKTATTTNKQTVHFD